MKINDFSITWKLVIGTIISIVLYEQRVYVKNIIQIILLFVAKHTDYF